MNAATLPAVCGASFFGMLSCVLPAGHGAEHADGIGGTWGSAPLIEAHASTCEVHGAVLRCVELRRADAPAIAPVRIVGWHGNKFTASEADEAARHYNRRPDAALAVYTREGGR